MLAVRWLAFLVALTWPLQGALADEEQASIEDFFGTYEGETVADNKAGLTKRDIGVTIKPQDKGFNVTWSTLKLDLRTLNSRTE